MLHICTLLQQHLTTSRSKDAYHNKYVAPIYFFHANTTKPKIMNTAPMTLLRVICSPKKSNENNRINTIVILLQRNALFSSIKESTFCQSTAYTPNKITAPPKNKIYANDRNSYKEAYLQNIVEHEYTIKANKTVVIFFNDSCLILSKYDIYLLYSQY